MIDYGSVCSGIEAASVAWHPLGMRAAWFAETAAFPSAVLAHHYPTVPNHGDLTTLAGRILSGQVRAPAILVGGTPCQDFSIAGMRSGLSGARGALTISYVETADAIDHVRSARGDSEAILLWENVVGVLSDKANAFGCFLAAIAGEDSELQPSGGGWSHAGCVYGPKRTVAWRVLDSQYFGLAQQRRRVFVVASALRSFDPVAVLFEREGVRRDSPPCRGEGQDVAGHAPFGPALQCGCGYLFGESLGVYGCPNCEGEDGPAEWCLAGIPAFGGENQESLFRAGTLTAHGQRNDFASETFFVHQTHDLETDGLLANASRVRRLMPKECERLQGFPDDHTRIPIRHYATRRISDLRPADMWEKVDGGWMLMAADGPRYKAIGNSKSIPVIRWLGARIQQQLE